jgi:hypothetical protein
MSQVSNHGHLIVTLEVDVLEELAAAIFSVVKE